MAIGKSKVSIKLNKLNINFGEINIVEKGELVENYSEEDAKQYMKNEKIDFNIELKMGSKNFTVYSMDLTKKYIEINSDYRS